MFDKYAKIGTIMTTDVKTVSPNTTMDKVGEIFLTNTFHHLPVVENGKVLGIISLTDYRMLEDHFTLFKQRTAETMNKTMLRSLLAKEAMTKQIATVGPDDSLEYAVGIFRENLFRALPVVDGDKQLLGIITPYDLMVYAFRPESLELN